ncbi:MAG: helix-turn-helix transcriptional regulator [Nocardioidaceae bacterium]
MWEAVGIPEVEASVYEALIPRGQSTVGDLAHRANVTPTQTSRALARLSRRGLVTRLPGSPRRYSASEPSLAGSVLIAKREQQLGQLQRHLNRLEDTYRSETSKRHPAESIEVIEGATKIWRTFVKVQRSAQEQVRGFDKPPYFVAPGEHGDEGPNLEERNHLGQGKVGYRAVYDQESVAIPGRLENIWEGIRKGEQARVATSLPVKLVMSDHKMAVISSPADFYEGTAYLIYPSSLLDVVAALFEKVWEDAVSLNRPEPTESQPVESNRDRQLLGLLASGATDAIIARTFGWSIRTVQRHIHRLMDQVGAETRFQVGMEAVRRGWL